jgi:Mg-chelatase subunit ChlD
MNWLPGITFSDPVVLLGLLLIPILLLVSLNARTISRPVRLIRAGLLAALVLTLAQPLLVSTGTGSTTVFVIDRSQSIASGDASAIESWVSSALASAGSGDSAAVVAFGASPDVVTQATDASVITRDWADGAGAEVDPSFTNLESALALARAMPVGGPRRIVLISDGAENLGAVESQIAQAAADGVPIDVLPITGLSARDLRIDSVTAPASIWQGEQPNVLVSVATEVEGAARLELLIDGALISAQELSLPVGLSTFSFPLPLLNAGFHELVIRVSGDDTVDQVVENNLVPAALIVRDEPRVLLVAQAGSDPSRLEQALVRRGASVEVTTPDLVPAQLTRLGEFDAYVLDNVPATALTVEQIRGLQQAVRTLGRGLIAVGGTSSYGPGQYANTRLEDMLPVTVKVTDGRERQRVALLLVVDRSGSMAYDPLQETSKMEMAKEAMRVAGTALAEGDTIGVLAFSDSQEWIFPLTQIEGKGTLAAVNEAVAPVKASGGTEIYPALQVGLDTIRNVDADVRHVILISDGKSKSGTQEAFLKLVSEAGADRTSVSTIAIGNDADANLLQAVAQAGGGRYHFTARAEEIPRLTLEEAQSAGAQSVIRGAFQPVQTLPSPIMTGFEPAAIPVLDGYDYAEARPTAQVILVSHRNDPVLAKWQYGLGRVVAWTADDGIDLASQWSAWERYDEFWAGMLRWTLPDPDNRTIDLSVERDGPDALLAISATAGTGDYIDLSSATARITGPDEAVTDGIALSQSGPGDYQIRVADPQAGAYHLEVFAPDGATLIDEIGFTLPGSPELEPITNGASVLERIATATGGRFLALDNPGEVFDAPVTDGDPVKTYRPIWFWTAILALILFLTELMVRLNGIERFAVLTRAIRRSPIRERGPDAP